MSRPRLRVALLCSHRAPGLEHLLSVKREHAASFELVCLFSSEEHCAAEETARDAGIPFVWRSVRAFHRERHARLADLGARADYDRANAELLSSFEPDLLLLSSYLYILTEPMLSRFPERIFNVHHSDLTLRDRRGSPRYVGLHAVREAILAGEPETRATLHLVTSRLDEGPSILRSWAFPVSRLAHDARRWSAMDVLKAYAFAHQEWMLGSAWGPLFEFAMELLAAQRLTFLQGKAWIDGLPGPFDVPEGRAPGHVEILDHRRPVELALPSR